MATGVLVVNTLFMVTLMVLFAHKALRTTGEKDKHLRIVLYSLSVNMLIMALVNILLLCGVKLPDEIDDMATTLLLVTLIVRVSV